MSQANAPREDTAPPHGPDAGRLAAWLGENVDGFRELRRIASFKGGQSNPTYRLDAGSGTYVLRRKPPGVLLPSAHAVDREYRVLAALERSEVPVARPLAYCADSAVIGSPFYVMAHVEGRVFWDPRLPELAADKRRALFASMNRTIAALHRVDPMAVGLGDYGRPGAFMERQIARWSKQYRASETGPLPSMEALMAWLPDRLPGEGEARIFHGDYRLDNLIVHPTEPRVIAVLDWELSTLGDPLADFAYHAMIWRIAPEVFRGLGGVDLDALFIPPEVDYVAEYCRATGRDGIRDWDFYIVFSMFRIAAILQGIARRAIDGTAADPNAAEVGRLARPIADQAWSIASRL